MGTNTSPTETEAIAWLNDGTKVIASLLCPQMLPGHKSTPGRLDKIQGLIESKELVNGVDTAVVTLGNADLPSDPSLAAPEYPILYYKTIEFSAGAAAYKPARLVSLMEVLEDYQRSTYIATAARPICAFGDGVMVYSPSGGSIDRVKYTFVEEPTAMVKTSAEAFPLSKDLMIPTTHYARYMMWDQKERNSTQAQRAYGMFSYIMSRLTGFSQEMIDNAVS